MQRPLVGHTGIMATARRQTSPWNYLLVVIAMILVTTSMWISGLENVARLIIFCAGIVLGVVALVFFVLALRRRRANQKSS